MPESYLDHVNELEQGLGAHALKTKDLTTYADSTDVLAALDDEWRTPEGRARLLGRTPVTLDRDRILYSDELRSQSDRYHLIFVDSSRVRRSYVTHTLRVAQVARSIAGRLSLNTELCEAIALGSKVGATPFIHRSKIAVDQWVQRQVNSLNEATPTRPGTAQLAMIEEGDYLFPTWVSKIKDPDLLQDVKRYLPWAYGSQAAAAYSSGQQSYWTLACHPFQLTVKRPYLRQTLYGIWNHSLAGLTTSDRFRHSIKLRRIEREVEIELTEAANTHEAAVVQYADDITWVIENLNESARAMSLARGRSDIFFEVARYLHGNGDMPSQLHVALSPTPDSGRVYTYFIDDLVTTTQMAMSQSMSGAISVTGSLVRLSETGLRILQLMKQFLDTRVFANSRISHRNRSLSMITETALDVLHENHGAALLDYLAVRSRLEGWSESELSGAQDLIQSNGVHRIQACVDALALMSDREVYDLIGLESFQ